MSLSISDDDLKKMNNINFSEYFLKMKEYAKINNVPIIQDEGLAFLLTLVRIKKPIKILEIGTAIGYSASMMANEGCEVYTIEREPKMYEQALINVENLGLSSKVHLIFKDALEAYDLVKDNEFDMIFIDAAKAQYTNFFNLYSPLLSKNGIIVTDNMLFHGVKIEEAQTRALRGLIRKLNAYTNFLLENQSFNTTIFNLGDGMAVSTRR